MAIDAAGGERAARRVFEDRVDYAGGEDAGEQRADSSAGTMHAKGVKGVVVAEEAFDYEDHEEADEAGYQADDQGAHGLYKSGGGGDGDQSGDCAGDCAEGGGLAVVNPFGDGPADGGGGGGEVSVDEGAGGQGVRGESAAGVETEPTHPQQASADEAEHHGVGLHFGVGIAEALAQIEAADQRGDAAGNVDDGAAGEIERGKRCVGVVETEDSVSSPDHVGHGAVYEERPEGEKDCHGAELHAFGKCAADERRGDDGEHELVDHEGLLGNGGGVVGVGSERDASQE